MNQLLKKLHSKHPGSWVSVSQDYSKIHAHSKDLDNLVAVLKKRNITNGMIIKIPDQKYSVYVG